MPSLMQLSQWMSRHRKKNWKLLVSCRSTQGIYAVHIAATKQRNGITFALSSAIRNPRVTSRRSRTLFLAAASAISRKANPTGGHGCKAAPDFRPSLGVFLISLLEWNGWRCTKLGVSRSEEHTSELQSLRHLVC